MDPQSLYKAGGTASMSYTHCKTQIVNLLDLDIPSSATEDDYKALYNQISQSGTKTAQALTDAVSSVSLGIAPPVAFPTETVYGLGADATNHTSIAGIFAAKGRPSDNPLIVHVASAAHIERLTGEPIPSVYNDLIKEYWPGPLTVLIPIPDGNTAFAPNVHPGQRTIGFRIPSSRHARFFIAATGKPIAAPSANSSGKPSPTTAQHVLDDMKGKINFILDGGSCDVGVESTVVDGLHDPPLILRPGGLSQDDLIAHGRKHGNVWAQVGIEYKQTHESHSTDHTKTNDAAGSETPRAPGMKYKHYAPQGRMILFEGPNAMRNLHGELDSITAALAISVPTTNGTAPVDCAQHPHTTEPVHIAILTTTSTSQTPSTKFHPSKPPSTQSTSPLDLTPDTDPWSNPIQPSTPASPLAHATHKPKIQIHTIPLGGTPPLIAQSLFAALRHCDDLKCQYILAEAPERAATEHRHFVTAEEKMSRTGREEREEEEEQERIHAFDAVLERMRKAASLVVGSS